MRPIRNLESEPWFSSAHLVVRRAGVRETMPPSFIERPKGTGDCLFMMFHDPVEIGLRTARRQVMPPSIIFWSRSSPHFYGNTARRWAHSWIHCDGPAIAAIIRRCGAIRDQPIPLHDPLPIEQYIAAIHEEITLSTAAPDAVVIRNLLENLVRKAAVSRLETRTPRLPASVALVKSVIDARYEERFTLSSLAEMARQSPRHFCTEFRRHVGTPPIAYLNLRRLHAAAALLRGTDEPVATIGKHVGLSDPYYFSKLFKSCFGVCPTRLRKRSVHHSS
jgi:AraC family transcriptional regulator, arabinose operon regulatory protein